MALDSLVGEVTGGLGGGATGRCRRIPACRLVACRRHLETEGGDDDDDQHGDTHDPEHRQGAAVVVDQAGGHRRHDEGAETQADDGEAGGQGAPVRPPFGGGGDGRQVNAAAAETGDDAVIEVEQPELAAAGRLGGLTAGGDDRGVRRLDGGHHVEAEGHDDAADEDDVARAVLVAQAAGGEGHETEDQADDRVGHGDLGNGPTELGHEGSDEHTKRIQQ